MKDLYMIKIGGGQVTEKDKPQVAKTEEIRRILMEIKEARRQRDFDVIIGHGSGSFGHVTAKQYRVNEGLVNEDSRMGALLTLDVAHRLKSIFIQQGIEIGLPLFPFSVSSFGYGDGGKRLVDGSTSQIREALNQGFIPLVHGDVVIDRKQGVGIASTEEILRFISMSLKPKLVLMSTDVDGVFDKNPIDNPGAKLIEVVDSSNIEGVISSTGGAKKTDVTGGMKMKVSVLYEIVKSTGATGYIANASKPGLVLDVLLGNEVRCTKVMP